MTHARLKVVHYSVGGPALTLCNSGGVSVTTSRKKADVTCKKCCAALEKTEVELDDDDPHQAGFEEGKREAARFYRRSFQELYRHLGFDQSQCRGCRRTIFWATHANGKRVPYTVDGVNHFVDCKQRGMFKK